MITLTGPRGRRTIPAVDADTMPPAKAAELVVTIQSFIEDRPDLDVKVFEADDRAIVIEWETKS